MNVLLKAISVFFMVVLLGNFFARAQNTDDQYRMPLKDVLHTIEDRFGIKIKYDENQVKDRWLNYALWRFRPNVEETLTEILTPLDLKVNKEKEGVYKLKEYEYYRWQVKKGWETLDHLAAQYDDKASWELRKDSLRKALWKALKLDPLPNVPNAKPIMTSIRKMNGYTVQNIALEILPGVYVNGSLYRPINIKGKIPIVLSPDGHWQGHRFRKDAQLRFAMTARMGAMAFSYDLFGWGESGLQFKYEDHRRSLSQTVQTLGAIRILDYLLSLKEADTTRVAICGGSGGGSQTVLMSALDPRIKLSIPVVSLSSYFYGGCPCESGMPIHLCGGGTDNVEIAAMTAPHPQLVISDGGDWTAHMPEHDFPYLQKIYGYYEKQQLIENVHLPQDGHDFGFSKRKPVYDFLIKHFGLDDKLVKDAQGNYDETKCTIEEEHMLYVFGKNGEKLPPNAIKGYDNLEKMFE
ncbi:MAG TPA: acetylxylan esterase [Pseudosphingobacterium sp.]|nr:acetylxylan esterase [Pseudosphingobacterium sp.]